MKTIKLFLIIIVILNTVFDLELYAQDPYYYFFTTDSDTLKEVSFPDDNNNNYDGVITWDKTQGQQIPFYNLLNGPNYPNDTYFYSSDMLTEFYVARHKWQNNSAFMFDSVNTQYGNVYVWWSNNVANFPKGVSNIGGFTPLAVDNKKIVPVSFLGSQTQYDQTQIIFNSTVIRNFKWTTEYILPQSYLDDYYVLNFQNVALHELGHLLGLSHNHGDHSAIMYDVMDYGDIAERGLESSDISNISELANITGIVTGIEDGVFITEDLDHYDINHLYVGDIHMTFVDYYPYGNYLTSTDDWKITASYGCGNVLIYEGSDGLNIPTPPSGYKWERDENGYVIGTVTTGGTDNDGVHHEASLPIKIGNVPNTFIASGTLTNDTTYWCGDITLTGSITVPSGKVLVVYPTSTIRFPSSASLVVNGKLNASGCTFTSQSGTSPNSWGSIELSGSGASGSEIKNANIYYGNEIDIENVSNFEISNCYFTNNYKAIYAYNSHGTISYNHLTSNSVGHSIDLSNCGDVDCIGNTITKTSPNQHQGSGIEYGTSSGTAESNDISYCNWGIGAIWGASPNSDLSSYPGLNNRIRNCIIGICVYRNSYPTFGIPSAGDHYGYNSIYSNTTNASVGMSYTSYASGLYACYNWWGSNPPNTSLFSVGSNAYLDYLPYVYTDPWSGIPKTMPGSNTSISSLNQDNSLVADTSLVAPEDPSSIFEGIYLRQKKQYKDAKNFFISYISKHPDDQQAYVQLFSCYNKETASDIINFFKALPSQASDDNQLFLACMYVRHGDIDMAKKVNNNIISAYPNTSLAQKATINNALIALFNESDFSKAVNLYSNAINTPKLSTSMELNDLGDAIRNYAMVHNIGTSDLPVLQKSIATTVETPKTYALLGNYPNPFNPTTNISYDLPKTSEVEVTIYDVLGKEIRSFTFSSQGAGRQQIMWDGKNDEGKQVSSGIYLYHFRAKSLEKDNNVFEKSAKMIMLK